MLEALFGAKTRPSFSGLLTNITETDTRRVWPKVRKCVSILQPPKGIAVPLQDVAKTPTPDGYVRLVCVSDTHTAHNSVDPLPPGDILVHAGDFTDAGHPRDIASFASWLAAQTQFKHRVVIAGNHDLSLDAASYGRNYKRFGHEQKYDTAELEAQLRAVCTYLNHEAAEVCGLRFFGSPYSPWFHDWGFNLDRNKECFARWQEMVPAGAKPVKEGGTRPIDVLVTHGPPMGHGDDCVGSGHNGCADLLDFVEAYEPLVNVFGHIHEGYGITSNGRTLMVNASTMNYSYDVRRPNPPLVIDVPTGDKVAEWRARVQAESTEFGDEPPGAAADGATAE